MSIPVLEVASTAAYEEGKLMEPVEYFIRRIGSDVSVADMVDPEFAAVFAAAPDLLAALKVMEAWAAHAFDADDPDMDLPELEQARTAIAKAEGKETAK